MSTLKIEERVAVKAPPERVWKYLLSPEDIVTCLPGAGLDEVEDPRNFFGNIKVKVGPVTVAYKGKATLTEVDDDNRRVTMVGEGKEKGGAGKVKMTMKSHVEAVDGGSEVVVDADVQLAGKVVRFGRGMIQGVSKEVFKQFGERLRANLEVEAEGAPDEAPTQAAAAEPSGAEAAEPAPESADLEAEPTPAAPRVEAAAKEPPPARPEPAGATPVEGALERAAAGRPEPEAQAAPAEDSGAKPAPQRAVAPREQEAVNAFGLVFKVIWSGIVDFFRRLFGKA